MMIRLKGFILVLEPGVLGFLQFPRPTRLSQFDIHHPQAVRLAGIPDVEERPGFDL